MKSKSQLTEEQIRPKKLINKIEKHIQSDIKFLKLNRGKFTKVACPACQNKKNKKYLTKSNFKYLICEKCFTFFLSPRPTKNLLEKFYKQSAVYNFFNNFIFPITEKNRSKKIVLPRIKKIIELSKKYNLDKPSIMEVGAGFGTFCHYANKSKYFSSVMAVEPSPEGAANCKKKNINVYQGVIEKLDINKKFDLLVNFEVIEHLFSPKNFLNSMKKFLKKKGFIILTCPNGMGFDIQLLKEKSDSIDHEHINYFNPSSIKKLFRGCGYKVLEVFTPGQLDVDIVRNKILNKKFFLNNNSFYEDIIIKNYATKGVNFQKFLVDNNLSSNMWVVAQKK